MAISDDITVVTERGQVSIPSHLRKELLLQESRRLACKSGRAGDAGARPRGSTSPGAPRRCAASRDAPGRRRGGPPTGCGSCARERPDMAWGVDTGILVDVLEDDPEFGAASARARRAHTRRAWWHAQLPTPSSPRPLKATSPLQD